MQGQQGQMMQGQMQGQMPHQPQVTLLSIQPWPWPYSSP